MHLGMGEFSFSFIFLKKEKEKRRINILTENELEALDGEFLLSRATCHAFTDSHR
jgi:hypothetical protein